jgi:alpha-glucosidase (family GH31 glycosyl hydrolase)
LVAPLFAGEAQRTVILPKGDWHDLWTGAPIAGDRKFLVTGATRNIPVYIKSGSVLPWASVSQHAGTRESRQLQVRVYGDGHLAWTAPESVGGLHLAWNNATKRGSMKAGAGNGLKFQVTEWKEMG